MAQIIVQGVERRNSYPLVSVVIPSFNHGRFLREALESVVNQTYSNWEIIVIDNHSNDETDEVIKDFMSPRLHIIKFHNGGSIAASRNLGIKESKGAWVAFLDSDDVWDKNKIEVCSRYFNNGVDLIYHDMNIVYEEPTQNQLDRIRSRQVKAPVLQDLLLKGNTIATSSVIVRTSILNKVGAMNESLALAGTSDINAWLKIARVTESFIHVPFVLGLYRRHGQNISKVTTFLPPWAAIEEFLPLLSRKEQRQMVGNFNYVNGRLKFLSKSYKAARPELIKVIRMGSPGLVIKSLWMLAIGILSSSYSNSKVWKKK